MYGYFVRRLLGSLGIDIGLVVVVVGASVAAAVAGLAVRLLAPGRLDAALGALAAAAVYAGLIAIGPGRPVARALIGRGAAR
jgi:hypothetical protein